METFPNFKIAIRSFGKWNNIYKELCFQHDKFPNVKTVFKEGVSHSRSDMTSADLVWEPEISNEAAIALCKFLEVSSTPLKTTEVKAISYQAREIEFSKGILKMTVQWESTFNCEETRNLNVIWEHINEALKI